ncbi:SIMPL domain-containing protein, partial [Planktotalea sp.]|uniref:SIMPL domain-containing protein n=1 Tax=Planktotalea sp. TaxID=2029877 RepID=UPI00329A2E85
VDAKRKAELYALAAGVSLGRLALISEDTSGGAHYPAPVMEMAVSRSGGVPIAQGEVTQSARIKLIFEIAE